MATNLHTRCSTAYTYTHIHKSTPTHLSTVTRLFPSRIHTPTKSETQPNPHAYLLLEAWGKVADWHHCNAPPGLWEICFIHPGGEEYPNPIWTQFFSNLKLSSSNSASVHGGHWQSALHWLHGHLEFFFFRLPCSVLAAQIPLNRNFKWKLSRFWVDQCITWKHVMSHDTGNGPGRRQASVSLRLLLLATTAGHCRSDSEICPQEQ